jgi:hypothetical protein
MRILICGDRKWKNELKIQATVETLLNENFNDYFNCISNIYVIEGEAPGADTLGRKVAEELGLKVLPFPAPWNDIEGKPAHQIGTRNDGSKYWKAAGPYRNQQMLTEGKPDIVLAFHNDIGNSKGTLDMIKRANKAGVEVRIYAE